MHRVYIILVNWNGWRDTIECLESLFRLDYPDFSIIVCDNASSDDSLSHIRDWASGSTQAECSSGELRRLTRPPVRKPLESVVLRNSDIDQWKDRHPKLVLLETGANLGFAGGNNVGLSYALSRGDFHYIWLLNNDTVVEPDSLAALVARASSSDTIGICGSKILYYDSPNTVQALGGSVFNRWFARGGLVPRC
jgi:GT2 family glycosyltransferase